MAGKVAALEMLNGDGNCWMIFNCVFVGVSAQVTPSADMAVSSNALLFGIDSDVAGSARHAPTAHDRLRVQAIEMRPRIVGIGRLGQLELSLVLDGHRGLQPVGQQRLLGGRQPLLLPRQRRQVMDERRFNDVGRGESIDERGFELRELFGVLTGRDQVRRIGTEVTALNVNRCLPAAVFGPPVRFEDFGVHTLAAIASESDG